MGLKDKYSVAVPDPPLWISLAKFFPESPCVAASVYAPGARGVKP